MDTAPSTLAEFIASGDELRPEWATIVDPIGSDHHVLEFPEDWVAPLSITRVLGLEKRQSQLGRNSVAQLRLGFGIEDQRVVLFFGVSLRQMLQRQDQPCWKWSVELRPTSKSIDGTRGARIHRGWRHNSWGSIAEVPGRIGLDTLVQLPWSKAFLVNGRLADCVPPR